MRHGLLFLIFSLVILSPAKAVDLSSFEKVSEMAAKLNDSRYDYEGGVGVRLIQTTTVFNKFLPLNISKGECHPVQSDEIVIKMYDYINEYRSFYYDDDFDFYSALNIFAKEVLSLESVQKCENASGKISYYQGDNVFLISYKEQVSDFGY